jgi:hypothetical protein
LEILVGNCNQHTSIVVAGNIKRTFNTIYDNSKLPNSQLTCSVILLGSNGSPQKAETSDEQRQHLTASTEKGLALIPVYFT